MADNNSLPTKSGELIYGPDLLSQQALPDANWNPSAYTFSSATPQNADPFSNLYNGFKESFNKPVPSNPFVAGAPQPFNAESTLFDRFESSWDFESKGFIPWRDNDDVYNEDTNLLKELYRSTKWAAPLFGEGFVSGLRTFPDLVAGVFSGDWDQMFKTDDVLAEKWSRATKMGGSTAGGLSSFLTNFEISAANMLGMITEVVIEDALVGALTVGTAGAAAPLAAAEVGKTASVFKSIYQGLKNLNKVTDIFKEANNARRFYEISASGAKAFGKKAVNFLNPLEQTIGGFGKTGFIKGLVRNEEYLANSSTLGKAVHGFGAFYRDLREINFALTEAKLEGGFSYLERKDRMVNDYIAEHNKLPEGQDAIAIEQNARDGGDFTTKANMPIIFFSNRIGIGNLFKGYSPLAKMMAEAEGTSIFKNIRFNSAKKLFEEAKGFSLKNSFKQTAGSSLNYFKANFMEGIQENLQDVIQGAADDYYTKRFNNPSYGGLLTMTGDIANQFGSKVFTGQGAETFASGFLMGGVMATGIKAKSGIQNLTYRLSNPTAYKEFTAKRSEQINKYVSQLNEVYQDPTKYLDPQFLNAARQGELNKYLKQAVANKNKKEFYDIKDQAVYEHLWTMARMGKSEIFKDRLQEMKQLTPEEFENAMGFKIENPNDFKNYIDDQIKKVDQIQSLYEKAEQNLTNPVNLGAFKKDSPAYNKAAQQYIAFENAKQQAVFANYTFMRNAERMRDLMSEMSKVKMMGKTSYTDLNIISDPKLLEKERDILRQEIANLVLNATDAQSKKLLKEKLKKLKTLDVWDGVMSSDEIRGEGKFPKDYPSIDNPAYENWRSAAKLAFEKLVAVEADIQKDSVYREGVDETFDMIMDYHTLGRESQGLMEVVNLLADPKTFLKLYEGHYQVIQDMVARKETQLQETIDNLAKSTDKNSLAGALLASNFIEDPEFPGTYYKATDKTPVEKDSEDYKKIQEIIERFKNPPAEPPATPPVSPASVVSEKESDRDVIENKIKEALSEIYRQNKDALDEGFAEFQAVLNDVRASGGMNYHAHGMGKSTIASAFNDLFNLFNNNLDKTRNNGKLYTAPLGATGAETGGATASGAYADSPFMLISRTAEISDINQVSAILVNDGLTNIRPDLISLLQQRFPNLVIEKYSDAKKAVEKLNEKTPETKSLLDELLDEVKNSESEEDLNFFSDFLDSTKPEYKSLTDAERAQLGKAVLDKLDAITGGPIVEEWDENDPKFKAAYNKAIAAVKTSLQKPDLTDKDIIDAYNAAFMPVLTKLKDKAVKARYKARLVQERNATIAKLEANKRAKDLNVLKELINDAFKNNLLLGDIENAVFTVFASAADPSLKQELFDHFDKKLTEHFQKEIAKIEKAATVGPEGTEVAKKYIEHIEAYRAKVTAALERYKKQAEDIARRTVEENERRAAANERLLNLAVDVDPSYQNDVHVSITENYPPGVSATAAQKTAISNLITSGVLLPTEVDWNNLSIHQASEYINLGVARIYTIGINKGINVYLKTGKTEILQKELSEYHKAARGGSSLAEVDADVAVMIEQVKQSDQTAKDILSILDIPETAEISDDDFKMLKQFKSAIYNVQTEASFLAVLDEIKQKQENYLAQGIAPKDLEDLLDKNIIKVFAKLIDPQHSVDSFYNDFFEVVEKVQTADNVKEADTLVAALVNKYSKPNKSADVRNLVKAFIGYVIQTQGVTSGAMQVDDVLTDDEIIAVLNGEKRTLTPGQVNQVKAYERDLLEMLKGRFMAAPGYKQMLLEDYEGEPFEISLEEERALKYIALREKDPADLRTQDDLTTEYKAEKGTISVKTALQKIMNSEYATEAEKELAANLMPVMTDEVIYVDNNMVSAGEFDPETGKMFINLGAVAYKEEYPSNPVETVILHEILHGQIEKAMQSPDSSYAKAIKSLYASVKTHPKAKTFYAFQSDMSEDEQMREFVIEAFTNPAFQRLLATVPYAKSGKSAWQKFIEILNSIFRTIGIDVEGTVLNEVVDLTSTLIRDEHGSKMMDRLVAASTVEELAEIEASLNDPKSPLSPEREEGMRSAIKQKRLSISDVDISNRVRGMKMVKLSGKTYYFKVEGDTVRLYKRTRAKLLQVKDPVAVEQFIHRMLKDKGIEFIGKNNIAAISSLMGDPKQPGSYASGMMEGTPIIESRLKNAAEAEVVLKFADLAEFQEFRKQYWKMKRKARDAKYRNMEDLMAAYPGRGVVSFVELANGFGGSNRKNGANLTNKMFDRLIAMGKLRLSLTGNSHEDYTQDDENPASYEDFVELYEMMLSGANMTMSDKQKVETDINNTFKDIFGTSGISRELQKELEDLIQKSHEFSIEESLSGEPGEMVFEQPESPVPPAPSKPGKTPGTKETKSITAINTNALRSYSYDITWDSKEETDYFKNYYHKIREIINILSLKPLSDLKGVYITLVKDDANLRWDGSAQDQGWQSAQKGVIGYLSDIDGDPIVFNKAGDRVGYLEKSNLSDKKGLDDGSNQIIYFTTFTKESNTAAAKALTPESKQQLLEARERVMAGQPQTAKLVSITSGEMNKSSLVTPNSKAQKNTKYDPEFRDQLMASDITFQFNSKGDFVAVLKAPDGAVNSFGMWAPSTRNVIFPGTKQSLFDYLIDLMKIYNEMKLRGEDVARVEDTLAIFVNKMWFTGMKTTLQIPKSFTKIQIKPKGSKVLIPLQIFTIKNGEVILNQEAIEKARVHMNNMKVNIDKELLSGKIAFRFPNIKTSDQGVKYIQPVPMNYLSFLMKGIGLSSSVTAIPSKENIKRYNSSIIFTNPTNLVESTPPIIKTTQQELLDNQDVIKDQVKDAMDNSTPDDVETPEEKAAREKRRRFKAPSYDQIFEKTCK